jgi:hypothetical protein
VDLMPANEAILAKIQKEVPSQKDDYIFVIVYQMVLIILNILISSKCYIYCYKRRIHNID